MATVANTTKDVSRSIAELQENSEDIERVAANLVYTMHGTFPLSRITGLGVAMILASHGYKGKISPYLRTRIANRIRFINANL